MLSAIILIILKSYCNDKYHKLIQLSNGKKDGVLQWSTIVLAYAVESVRVWVYITQNPWF